nr:immunoglobulin heavy chain junction region [Mus musculus]
CASYDYDGPFAYW